MVDILCRSQASKARHVWQHLAKRWEANSSLLSQLEGLQIAVAVGDFAVLDATGMQHTITVKPGEVPVCQLT